MASGSTASATSSRLASGSATISDRPSVYRDFVNDNGSEIAQDLKLRIVPISATIRFLPVGRGAAVEPYIGGGIGIFNWRYSEIGEFVDFSDGTIFREQYKADGTSFGPVIVAGLRIPDRRRVHGRLRVQMAESRRATPTRRKSDLLGRKIDSVGTSEINHSGRFTMHFRF